MMISTLIFALFENIVKGFLVYCFIVSVILKYWEELEEDIKKGFSIFVIVLNVLWWGGCIAVIGEELLSK